jgi:ABC-type Co2+ transport system permease subunit
LGALRLFFLTITLVMTDLLLLDGAGLWAAAKDWFFGLGAQYGVNPLIFGGISVGAIPFFWLSVARLVRNLRRGKSPFLPVLATALCVLSAYIYLFIAGENLPLWVYALVVGLIGYSAYSTVRTVQHKARTDAEPTAPTADECV